MFWKDSYKRCKFEGSIWRRKDGSSEWPPLLSPCPKYFMNSCYSSAGSICLSTIPSRLTWYVFSCCSCLLLLAHFALREILCQPVSSNYEISLFCLILPGVTVEAEFSWITISKQFCELSTCSLPIYFLWRCRWRLNIWELSHVVLLWFQSVTRFLFLFIQRMNCVVLKE